MVDWLLALVVLVLCSTGSSLGQTSEATAHLVFKGVEVPEHSLVVRDAIGTADANTLMCVTDFSPCCDEPYYDSRWRTDNGNTISTFNIPDNVIYQSNGTGVVRLHHRSSEGWVEGILYCEIRVADGDGGIQTLFVGIYPSVGDDFGREDDGTPIVSCSDSAFTLTSRPEADPPEFVLRCTSYGGAVRELSCISPGGDVSGIANGTDSFINTVSNRRQGNYVFVVSITGNYPGSYMCWALVYRYDGTDPEPQVIYYSAAQTIMVPAADPPTEVTVSRAGTTMRVYWTPPSPTPYGYRIYYQPEGGSQQFVVIIGGNTTGHNLTVPIDIVFTVSIQTLSEIMLPSATSDTVQSRSDRGGSAEGGGGDGGDSNTVAIVVGVMAAVVVAVAVTVVVSIVLIVWLKHSKLSHENETKKGGAAQEVIQFDNLQVVVRERAGYGTPPPGLPHLDHHAVSEGDVAIEPNQDGTQGIE